jgi:sulfide:quinone oxidoreductase
MKTHQIVIIGGGTGGITVASRLLRKNKKLDIAIIEPSEKHIYQPAWTLVGAGAYSYDKTIRAESTVMPKNATWIKKYAGDIDADNNKVILADGEEIGYEYLVVAPGIQMDIDALPGLADTLGKNNVCSNYVDPNYTWEVLQNFKGGTALFTQANTPIKCGGAPQKIMYMAEEYMRKHKIRDKSKVIFATPGSMIFGVPEFKATLDKIVADRDIDDRYFHALTRVDGPSKKAYFNVKKLDEKGDEVLDDKGDPIWEEEVVEFDMMHLAPPQSAPDFVKRSKLAHQEGPDKGWMNVDINTMQSRNYPNVFGLGDAAALPTAKTGAAIRKQAPVLVDNLYKLMSGQAADNKGYTGYSSCPIVTGYSKMLLCEFGYENKRMSDPILSKLVDTTKEQYSMWLLKKYVLPFMYWDLMLKGKA